MLLWSRTGAQLLPHHVAVVKGWWSTILIMLLWSRVGGQLLSHHVAVVRGWWSTTLIMLLWSGVGGQLLTRSLEGPFRGTFGNNQLVKVSLNSYIALVRHDRNHGTKFCLIRNHDRNHDRNNWP